MYCFLAGILNLGCQGIRIRRYVSNGFCTSRRPIRDMLCDGQCLPMDELPWFPEFSKIISRHKREWRCVPDDVRSRKVTVFCNDGTKHKYRVRVVRSCKCKRYTHKQNQTNPWRALWIKTKIYNGEKMSKDIPAQMEVQKHSFTILLAIVTYRCTKFQWVCKVN